jgi:two-component system phosphate regulon response regulator PhoB
VSERPIVLVCDNEEALRALVAATLEGAGYELVEARDGEQALAQARAVHPDLILLDMMMPVHTGLEVLAELRADPELADTPVVMLTARVQLTDREAALEAGADRFLAKPFSPLQLADVVAELLPPR